MESLPKAIELAVSLGLTPFNIVLIGILYFMGAHSGIFPKFWGQGDVNDDKPATKGQMDRLSNYYNHDTTELLTQIKEHLSDVKDETRTINATLQTLSSTTNRLENTIREWEKYGVPHKQK